MVHLPTEQEVGFHLQDHNHSDRMEYLFKGISKHTAKLQNHLL